MKRILPLILALVAGMAQADSNSDYRAGSDFAHQIKGQGSSSIQGFKPQESIPGYNANPDETKYYGGVTAGGDGGLKMTAPRNGRPVKPENHYRVIHEQAERHSFTGCTVYPDRQGCGEPG